MRKKLAIIFSTFLFLILFYGTLFPQGITTASMNGIVNDNQGNPLPSANVIAVHEPSGTQYGASTRNSGLFNLLNLKVGGPYTVTVSYVGYNSQKQEDIYLRLGQNLRLEFVLESEAVEMLEVVIEAEQDEVLNSARDGAATYINPQEVRAMPSIKRSTRDLTRLDPRSDGNFSFGGKNWLFNNISVDGSYFNNPFGLDDPAPGGQANAEPIPYDAVEQVQVSIAPYDVREGGFTGAGINTVTKSGTNRYKASVYSFVRNEELLGNKVSGQEVVANPDLSFNQSGVSVSGPLIPNKLFFFINGEIERRDDPGSNFRADEDGNIEFGESRVTKSDMDRISQIMKDVYDYDTGPYQGYIHETDNEKLIVKLDWNINDNNKLSFRYNRLDARRQQGPHPFVLASVGRGPNESSLPFQSSGYRINNRLNSFALELNSSGESFANRFFASFNRFRDYRDPFSPPFPTVQIDVGGINYTTLGHEPFSIHNILDQDVLQFTNNFSYFLDQHVVTVGATYEQFEFFNSFNIFRHGVFFLPDFLSFLGIGPTTFGSLDDFYRRTNPADPDFYDLNALIRRGNDELPFKGEQIDVGQLSFYAQDEFLVSDAFSLTFGVRVDIPTYGTTPVDNPYSTGLTLLDENDQTEIVDQAKLPDAQLLFSPRVGFNWDLTGDRQTQLRGGTGIFTGRLPFVWIGNVISNPGNNPNLFPGVEGTPGISIDSIPGSHKTSDDAILTQSFDLNGMVDDFKWPQVWTSNLAIDHRFEDGWLGTLEVVYGKDINSIYVRNADVRKPVRYLPNDGRPYYSDADGIYQLNLDAFGGNDGGAFVIDNSDEGYHFSVTAQMRKHFDSGLAMNFAYTFLEAKSLLKSTEIASVLWSENPVQGDPNDPVLSYSEFGNRHRIIAGTSYQHVWNDNFATTFGIFFEAAEGNRFAGAGGNRYSYTYAGDVNGDGTSNDLIYIPRDHTDIIFVEYTDAAGNTVTPVQQYNAFQRLILQDDYLKDHRGEIAERFGAVNPWFFNIDLRILQDISFMLGTQRNTFQLSIDILNVANLLNSDWGVRKVANPAATRPLELAGFDGTGEPQFKFDTSVQETFVDDPGLFSRWQMQIGLRYLFN